MRRLKQRHAVLAAAILIALPLSSNSPQVVTANQSTQGERSAFCLNRIRPSTAALMSFAGYRFFSLGLPWERISTTGFPNNINNSLPLISGLPAPGPALPTPLAVQTIDVSVNNDFFAPATVRISVGDTVRWTWQGTSHTVVSGFCVAATNGYEGCTPNNNFCSPSNQNCGASPPLGPGAVYSHQFNSTGSYPYFCSVHGNLMQGTVIVEVGVAPTIQFSSPTYSVSEGAGAATVAVSRGGATTGAATVDYVTSDTAGLANCSVVNGVASSRCDYPTSVGTVRFAAGETSKNISIPIVDDSYAEGNESFTVTLSHPTGGSLGTPISATVTINDNETSNGTNPVDVTSFFVRQQYLDFLTREPDPGGFAAWQAVINGCAAGDTNCDRIHVSSSFFRSPEFQDRGYFIYRFYPVSFGRKPDFVEFVPDLAKVSGFLSDAELEAAKQAFIADFMSRPAFVTKFNGLSDTAYVDLLLSTAGITHVARDFWIAALGNGTRTRAQVLREIAESTQVYDKYYNQAFVVMQYFGYLRRDPDAFYLDWIAVLDANPSDFRGMVNGFMNSLEYRFRFGP
jgi:plastocyanin